MDVASSKVMVVTGGTKGIGRALVLKFAEKGFQIYTCARHTNELAALKEEVENLYPVQLYYLPVDLADSTETQHFIQFVNHAGIVPDVLINNTGIYLPGQIHSEEEGILEKFIQINLYSAYRITRGFLPGMIARKSGHIFNICSTASIMPYVNGGSYCISKYALYGMTKVLREELKPFNMKVTAVLPGATLTASWEGTDLPSDRFMKPEDVAEAIAGAYELSPSCVTEEILLRPLQGDIV